MASISNRRRALTILAGTANGCTEASMLTQGFTRGMLGKLILAGLATAETERMVAGRKAVSVRRIKITDAGRRVALSPP
jgi:hypothetical protein